MIEKTWLVQALSIGISYHDFWTMNPHIVLIHIDAHKKQVEEQNLLAYIQGRYFVDALLCTVGNMFSGKGQKSFEYPKEPYQLGEQEEKEMTQIEKDLAVKELFANLQTMKENFDRSHKQK